MRPDWAAFDARAEQLDRRFAGAYREGGFDYQQPPRLQPLVPARLRKRYAVPVAYTDWGPREAPLLVCVGGVANTAMRFSFLAADLSRDFRVVCMDWLGRGRSGWLADDSEYTRASYVEQLRQLLGHLGARGAAVLGSSMGGSVALELAAAAPRLIGRLLLNDVGPALAAARRRRRAETLARFYVFRTPAEIERRLAAAQKNDGPVSAEIRHFLAWHQTRWSAEHGGRIYRHDPRALLAFRREAQHSVDQWASWARLRCPVLLLHGLQSDALSAATIARMRRSHAALSIAHIPSTGHTPLLSDRHQTHCIGAWLQGRGFDGECSLPLALPRTAWR